MDRTRWYTGLLGLLLVAVAGLGLIATGVMAGGRGAGAEREGIINGEIREAQQAAEEARRAAQEAAGAQRESEAAGQSAEQAKKHAEEVKTPEGKKKAEEAAEKAKQEAEKAKKAAEEAREQAERDKAKAAEEAEAKKKELDEKAAKAEEEAKAAAASNKPEEALEKLDERDKAKKEKEKVDEEKEAAEAAADERARKAGEEAEEAEEKAKEAEENADPEKAEEKAKEKEKEAEAKKKEAEEEQAEADRARQRARDARDRARRAVEEWKRRYGKPRDKKLDDALDELERATRDIAHYRVPEGRRATCAFVSLEGETALNPEYFGSQVSCTFLADDGTEMEQEGVAEITQAPDGTSILNVFNKDVAKVLVGGAIGTAVLVAEGTDGASDPGPGGMVARDGDIQVAPDGTFDPTVKVGDTVNFGDLGDSTFTVNDIPVDYVAAQDDQIGLYGYGLGPDELIGPYGTAVVAWRQPDGTVVMTEVPAWEGAIFVPPTTQPGQPMDIGLTLAGVPSNQEVIVDFIPGPGQMIDPLQVQGTAGDLEGVIGQITVETAGAHQLDAVITRGDLKPRAYADPSALTTEQLHGVVNDINLEKGARMLGQVTGRPMAPMGKYDQQMMAMYQQQLAVRMQ
jgi:hypothetical protein